MSKTFDIKLDVEKNLYSPMQILFYVANTDVDSVELDFEIIQDDVPFDLTGKTLQMAIKKPSGAVIYEGIEITSALEGKANTTLHQSTYVEAGLHTAEVYIQDAGETIVISPFYFNSWESISIQETTVPTDPTTGDVYWQNILSKPLTFPPSVHSHPISDVTGLASSLAGKMDDGDAYLKTETYNKTEIDSMTLGGGGGTNVIVEDNLLSTSTTNALSSNQGRILNETKSDVNHNHDLVYAPIDHDHIIADVTGLQIALDGKVDDAEMTGKADTDHIHDIADVTGLTEALAGKMDDGDAYLKINTYNKTEVYNKGEIDQMTMGTGGGSPVIVEDNLTSTSTTNALSSNQGRILNETKSDVDHNHDLVYAPIDHDHTSANITDFGTAVAGAIPPEYLTATEGDASYQPIGTIPAHTHDEYLTQEEADALFLTPTEGDLRYQASGVVPAHDHTSADITDFSSAVAGAIPPEYLTSTEADALFLTPTEGDASYQPKGIVPTHTHTSANITDFGTAVAGAIPTEYVTQTEGDARYQAIGVVPTHTHTKSQITDFAHTHTQADITLGGKNAQTYVDDADNYIMNTRMAGLTLWKGTQAQYDALTPVATTLYFITG